MTADAYLLGILAREAVDIGPYSPVRAVQAVLQPAIQTWAGKAAAPLKSGSSSSGAISKASISRLSIWN